MVEEAADDTNAADDTIEQQKMQPGRQIITNLTTLLDSAMNWKSGLEGCKLFGLFEITTWSDKFLCIGEVLG